MQKETRNCRNCSQEFTITTDDFSFYERMKALPPTWCPECRFKRRAVFRNEMGLHPHTCAKCSKSVISMYSSDSPYTIYCDKCWDSDTWDPFSYGKEYDFERPFFDQFEELFEAVPKKATVISDGTGISVNSEYTNWAGGNKNCYLIFNSGNNEDVMYSRGLLDCKNSVDSYFGEKLDQAYEAVNVRQSSKVHWGQDSSGCIDSILISDASNLQNCFGCVNLRNKSYYFFNEQLSKEEYERRVGEIQGSYSKMNEMKEKFEEFMEKFPKRENANLKTVDSSGNYLSNSKNVRYSFEAFNCEDCKFVFSLKNAKDVYDAIGYGYTAELVLDSVATGMSQRVLGSCWIDKSSQDIEYSFGLRACKECIGCDGLRDSECSILNKRYSEEEYKKIRDHIVDELKKEEWYGSFFPARLAPFGYNETVAQDNYPLTKEEALAQGFKWQDKVQFTTGKETLLPNQIPDHIRDVEDSITKEVLKCISCERNYRITPQEIRFYKEMIIPVPRRCFYCRHKSRVAKRGPIKFFNRTCSHCQKPVLTAYSEEKEKEVYCETCYQREVI